jgi:holliday junction DNA helicase RuvB
MLMDLDDDVGALELGAGYALLRHGQDQQTAALIAAMRNGGDGGSIARDPTDDPPDPVQPAVNALDFTDPANLPEDWDDYIGQAPAKNQLMVRLASAAMRDEPLDHVLLASGYPGVGKTTMARLIAKLMGVKIIEVVPPFKIESLVKAAQLLEDKDILFIDEIHKLTDGVGARGAEMLLKILEDRVAYLPSGEVIPLNQITVIGATTDRDKLPETVVDRFKIKPYFQAYSLTELAKIVVKFTWEKFAEDYVTDSTGIAMAKACRGTPRIIEEYVMAARDLGITKGAPPTPEELLEFVEVEPDGLTRVHIHYLTAMRQYFGRENSDGEWEFIVGEAAIMQILRETKQGIGRIERFLVERGLVDRTPRGRRLTPLGIARAEGFIAAGKGAQDVA